MVEEGAGVTDLHAILKLTLIKALDLTNDIHIHRHIISKKDGESVVASNISMTVLVGYCIHSITSKW